MLGIMQRIDTDFNKLNFSLNDLKYFSEKLLEKYTIEEVEEMNYRTLARELTKINNKNPLRS